MQTSLPAPPENMGGHDQCAEGPEPELKRRRLQDEARDDLAEQHRRFKAQLLDNGIHLLVNQVKAPTPKAQRPPTSTDSAASEANISSLLLQDPISEPLTLHHNPEPFTPRATSLGISIFTPTRLQRAQEPTHSVNKGHSLDLPIQPPSVRTNLKQHLQQPSSARATPSHPSTFAPAVAAPPPFPIKMQSGPGSPFHQLMFNKQREANLALLMQQGLPFMPSSTSSCHPALSSGATTTTPIAMFNGASPLAAVSQTGRVLFPATFNIGADSSVAASKGKVARESSPSSPLSRPLSPGSWLISKGKLSHHVDLMQRSTFGPAPKTDEDEKEAARDLLLLSRSHSPPSV